MTDIVFHSMEGSSYLWSLMQIAGEKGVPYRLNVIALNSPELFRLHPFGKMPILQHGAAIIYESLAIAHYIDTAFDGPALKPTDALGQAHVMRWISIVNAYVFPVMNRFFKERIVRPSWGFEPDRAFLDTSAEALDRQVRLIDAAVSQGGFLVGDRFTLADAFLFPNVLFFGLTPEGTALLDTAPAVKDWLARMLARPTTPALLHQGYASVKDLAAALYQTPPSTRITAPVV